MFTPSSLTISWTMWLTQKHRGQNACFILLYSFRVMQFLVQIVLDVHSEIHIGLQWCVNYCSTWVKTGIFTNFSKLSNTKFHENLYRGLSTYMQTHSKHSEAKRHTVKTFHYKYAKQIICSFLEMSPGIILSGGTTEVHAKPP